MRYLSRALLAGGLGLAAAFLVACGAGSGLLSASDASSLQAKLGTASADITRHDCVGAERAIGAVETQVANLPGSVDPTLVSDLNRGTQTVRQLAKTQCNGNVGTATNATTPTPKPTTTHPRTTSTATSPTTTSTTTTPTNPTTPSTQPTPTTPSPPATSTPTPGTSTGGGGGAPTGNSGQGNSGNSGQGD